MNKGSGKVLDVNCGSLRSGENMQQWEANGTAAQTFKLAKAGSLAIISALANNALDGAGDGRGNGTNVQSYRYNGTQAQHWFVQRVGTRDGAPAYRILGASSRLALDVSAGAFRSGTNVQLWEWNSSAAQVWAIEFGQ